LRRFRCADIRSAFNKTTFCSCSGIRALIEDITIIIYPTCFDGRNTHNSRPKAASESRSFIKPSSIKASTRPSSLGKGSERPISVSSSRNSHLSNGVSSVVALRLGGHIGGGFFSGRPSFASVTTASPSSRREP
jgi:hypothetical protein